MFYIFLVLLSYITISRGVLSKNTVKYDTSNTFNIELDATWNTIPFKLSYLESIASHNNSLFLPSIEKIIGYSTDSDNEEELEFQLEKSDLELYRDILDHLQLSATDRNFIDFNLVSKRFNPRVEAHYKHYEDAKNTYSERLAKECATDSFGNQIQLVNGMPQAWMVYNDHLYCSSDDLYALKTDSKVIDTLLPFDRVIGVNEEAPLLVLYGNIESNEFKDMFVKLMENAEYGKLRFVWRYIPSNRNISYEKLNGYGVDLTIKNPNNLISDVTTKNVPELKLEKDFDKILQNTQLYPLEREKIDSLGVKLMSFILRNNSNSIDLLNTILQDFPKFAPYIANYNPDNYEEIESIIKDNEKIGISEDSHGFYINGSPINKLELDIFSLVDKIKSELLIIDDLKALGFTTEQSKVMITKFSLISAVKNAQFEKGNNIMGSNENRYRIFEDEYIKGSNKGGVVFMNNIEKDETYYEYSDQRNEVYSDSFLMTHPNKIPPLRENIHDLIFALNFSDKRQLKVFFTFAKLILDNGIPQQIGLIPIPSKDEKDLHIAKIFYFITNVSDFKEALAFLYKYFETNDDEEYYKLINTIQIPEDYEYNSQIFESTTEKYSILEPSVVVNGVVHGLATTNWQLNVKNQIAQDIRLIHSYVSKGIDKNLSLKNMLYEGAKSKRNLRIIPSDINSILYKKINSDLIHQSILIVKENNNNLYSISGSFWLIGDFNDKKVGQQLINILEIIYSSSKPLQLRVINSGIENKFFEKVVSSFKTDYINESNIANIKLWFESFEFLTESIEKNNTVAKLLQENNLPVHHSYVLFNSRYFNLYDILDHNDLQLLVDYEFSQRFSIFSDIISSQETYFESKTMKDICNIESFMDWFDLLTSVVSNSFYSYDSFFVNDVFRYDLHPFISQKSININTYDKELPLDILLILDPISEEAQKMISILNSIKEFSFLNIKIILSPKLYYNKELNIQRYFRGVYPSIHPKFEINGCYDSNFAANFKNLPADTSTSADLDLPQRWLSVIKSSSSNIDLDNISFSNITDTHLKATYLLKHILVEGYARDVKFANIPKNLTLELYNKDEKVDTRVLKNLGYFQLKANPGLWNFRQIEANDGSYSLLSVTERKVSSNRIPLQFVQIAVTDISGHVLVPRFTSEKLENLTKENKLSKMKNFFNFKNENNEVKPKEAEVNIFTIASGQTYETLVAIMVASVREHSTSSIKFWFIENYLSPGFKTLIQDLSEKYNYEYEFISYKWPNWLRKQRQKHRTIWGYKILFLDVIFPQNLKKAIFVDADQISRNDMKELMDIDLEGAAYGFTPMCDSNKEMEGYMFWKKDYWSKVLKNDLKYHISAMFVVDLEKFKKIDAGDSLRSHYQKLSSDPNSLANLDQDLPNNLQRKIKIFSLPQEWLWCETWCSHDSLNSAKLIDFCNNPLSKENKLDVARRLIPEWTTYENEITKLIDERIKQESQKGLNDPDTTSHSSYAKELSEHLDDDIVDEDDMYYHDEL